jgi:hypothetical protein
MDCYEEGNNILGSVKSLNSDWVQLPSQNYTLFHGTCSASFCNLQKCVENEQAMNYYL